MVESARLFSNRYEAAIFSWDIADLCLASILREQILLAMARHSQAIEQWASSCSYDESNSRGILPALRLTAEDIARLPDQARSRVIWRSMMKTVLQAPIGRVFDVIEVIYGALPSGAQSDVSTRVNDAFEAAGLPWCLYRGHVRFIRLVSSGSSSQEFKWNNSSFFK